MIVPYHLEHGMRILVTAGPTREYLDEVRFLSNASSGRMGYAIAEAAIKAGHQIVLVSGPVSIPPLPGSERLETIQVETTQEMLVACESHFPDCDGVIGAAAVCDYRPKERASGKLRKTGHSIFLELVENPDILAELGKQKGERFVIGFSLDPALSHAEAQRKAKAKNCDAILLNSPATIGQETNDLELLSAEGHSVARWSGTKSSIARELISWISRFSR